VRRARAVFLVRQEMTLVFGPRPAQIERAVVRLPALHAASDGASSIVNFVRSIWEFVAPYAVRLPCKSGRPAVASEHILALCHKGQVRRIAALGVAANDVVDLALAPSLKVASRKRRNKPRIHESVCALHSAIPINSSVDIGRTGPKPASGVVVDLDLREDAGEGFAIEVRNREILDISHGAASCAVLWLEPRACFSTFAARLFYREGMANA
jgi:hypothetical protein